MSIENPQVINYAMGNSYAQPIKQSVNPFGAQGVGAVEKTPPTDLYTACEALSVRDGRSPDISGSACGAKLDIGKDGCIDNLAWGI